MYDIIEKRKGYVVVRKNELGRYVTVACALMAVSVVFMAKPCQAAKNKVHSYKKGFTYQKINDEIAQRMKGKSYKKGAKIPLKQLRYLRVRYIDFEGNEQNGEMVVNKKIAKRTLKVFYRLYKLK